MIRRDLIVPFPDCTLQFNGENVVTIYRDGAESWNRVPQDEGHFRFVSHCVGWGEDLLSYLYEHEFVHHFICYKFFDKPSYVVRNAALGLPLDAVASGLEERLCYYFQRFLHGKIKAPDDQWPDLAYQARVMLYPEIYQNENET